MKIDPDDEQEKHKPNRAVVEFLHKRGSWGEWVLYRRWKHLEWIWNFKKLKWDSFSAEVQDDHKMPQNFCMRCLKKLMEKSEPYCGDCGKIIAEGIKKIYGARMYAYKSPEEIQEDDKKAKAKETQK